MEKLLLMKERALLLYSEVIKQFPDILEIIQDNKDITDKFVKTLPKDKQNFFNNMLKQVLKQAISEWKGNPKKIEDMGPNKNNWKNCSLDNVPNKMIFYIFNKINGTELNVGSECIKHFWTSWSSDYNGKSIQQLLKDASQVRLMNDLNEAIPGVFRTIDNWNSIINNCEIIIPQRLEDPYTDLGKKASEILNDYLNEKVDLDYIQQLKSILKEQKKLIQGIEEYIQEKSSEKHIPKREVRTWLKIQGQSKVIDMLKKDGYITWGTAHRIGEPTFLKSLIPDLNNGLKDLGFKISDIDKRRSGYILDSLNERIKIFSKHNELIMFCGWLAFNEKPIDNFTLENLLTHCSLNENADVQYILDSIKYNYRINYDDVDFEYNEVFIYDKSTGKYVQDKAAQFANRFKGLIFGAKDITVNQLEDYIRKLPGVRYTKDEISQLQHQRHVFNKEKY